MRVVSRRCLSSLRRYFRIRFGFRTFLLSMAAVYFTAMYVFHASLNGRTPRDPEPPPPQLQRRWDAGGADDDLPQRHQHQQPKRRRRPDIDLQEAFDDIRRLDRIERREVGPEGTVDAATGGRPSSEWSDASLPASCDASAAEQRLLGDDFLPLAGTHLLSAFWDDRPNDFDNRHNGTLVRIMAVLRDADRRLAAVCDFGESGRTSISVYEMCENHRRPYGSFIFTCHVPEDVVEAPCFVRVVATAADRSVDVPVRTLRPRTVTHSFTVCVPPLFGDVPAAKLVEFFELTFILGADRIVIYDWKTSPSTHAVVQHYASRCRDRRRCQVDVIDWRLPETITGGIWYNGQSLAIQDCLYRQMASSRYVVFSDIDEFLVPHDSQLSNWTQLASSLERPRSCGFQFRSAFFDPDRSPPVEDEVRRTVPDLLTMRSTQRSQHISNVRTKCMVRPYEIFEAGIHHISKPIWAHLTVDRVDTDVALLHHYRNCVGMYGMNCAGSVDDSTVRRYFDALTRSVFVVWTELGKVL